MIGAITGYTRRCEKCNVLLTRQNDPDDAGVCHACFVELRDKIPAEQLA
jgi:hypothetical protein